MLAKLGRSIFVCGMLAYGTPVMSNDIKTNETVIVSGDLSRAQILDHEQRDAVAQVISSRIPVNAENIIGEVKSPKRTKNQHDALFYPTQDRSSIVTALPLSSQDNGVHPKYPKLGGAGGYTVNFEDISVLQLLQFVSKISGTNFVFDHKDLQFNVTIVSQDPTSVEDLSAILLQVLKMHDLRVVEQGNNVLIYKNPNISKLSNVVSDNNYKSAADTIVVTRVFKLYSLNPDTASAIIIPLLSSDAIVSSSVETRHIVISDISANVDKVADLLSALDSPSAAIEITEYEARYANPVTLASYCQELLWNFAGEDMFQVISQPDSKKLFIMSSSRLAARAIQLLKSLDVPEVSGVIEDGNSNIPSMANSPTGGSKMASKFFMYKLKYQSGKKIASSLQEIGNNLSITASTSQDFLNTLKTVQWLDVNNSVVIIGAQQNVEKVVSLLEGLDLPPKQVYIEVLILETTLEKSWDFGVQWIALGEDQGKLAYGTSLLNSSVPGPNLYGAVGAGASSLPPSTPLPGHIPLPTPNNLFGSSDLGNASSAFGLGIIGNVLRHNGQSFLSLGSLLSALDQDGDTMVVLNPRIMAQDTQLASFFVGQRIPFKTKSSIIQETGTVTESIEYEDIGVDLKVTSTIAPNNVVTLQIEQTISELSSLLGLLTPTTNKTYASTRLQVPDGCFLVMSGHIRDKTTKVRSGIPFLGQIPIIKHIFSREIEQRQKRNIMMFIKPKVITAFEEGTELSNQEGYRYNWEANRDSLEIAPQCAPECQMMPVVKKPISLRELDLK